MAKDRRHNLGIYSVFIYCNLLISVKIMGFIFNFFKGNNIDTFVILSFSYSNSVDLLSVCASGLLQNCSIFRSESHHF